ncbi:MAG TPA: alternative ribosome rescue aminoacyl-tRNA hydrolase ArfB [Puia sp.]|nr:alternative ribosome rescue aminoacyl-tRNA hydrolase ArfB [Puia sp.]
MKIDVFPEIIFKTARSGGKGGQNVNKVESMVEGYFHIDGSPVLNREQKTLLQVKLANKINAEGFLHTRSQVHRSQLENKKEVIKKINSLIDHALKKEKKRLATKPTKGSKEKRIESKKKNSEIKVARKKVDWLKVP